MREAMRQDAERQQRDERERKRAVERAKRDARRDTREIVVTVGETAHRAWIADSLLY